MTLSDPKKINVVVGPISQAHWAVVNDPKDSGLAVGELMIWTEASGWTNLHSLAYWWKEKGRDQYMAGRKSAEDAEYLKALNELGSETPDDTACKTT